MEVNHFHKIIQFGVENESHQQSYGMVGLAYFDRADLAD